MKRPSFQFYPADWRANAKLRRCSRAERGDWIDLLCLLHDSEEYGVLRWPLRDIAKALGCQVGDLRKGLIAKGVLKGADAGQCCKPFIYVSRHAGKDGAPVTLIPSQEGPLWYSSRLVRDEHVRNQRALNDPPKYPPKGSFGVAQGAHLSRDARAHPSSASSASSSSMKITARRAAPRRWWISPQATLEFANELGVNSLGKSWLELKESVRAELERRKAGGAPLVRKAA